MTPGVDGGTADGTSPGTFRSIIAPSGTGASTGSPRGGSTFPRRMGSSARSACRAGPTRSSRRSCISILEPYFEAKFRDSSHSFRPGRGCHTALAACSKRLRGCSWLIEGDIKGYYDNIDHGVLSNILRESIDDERFIQLVSRMLEAGYLEEWRLNETLSGTPRGGSSDRSSRRLPRQARHLWWNPLSPVQPRGRSRGNPDYKAVVRLMAPAEASGDPETWARLKSLQRSLPSLMPDDGASVGSITSASPMTSSSVSPDRRRRRRRSRAGSGSSSRTP